MLRNPAQLRLRTAVEAEVAWNGSARVRRVYRPERLGGEAVDVEHLAIGMEVSDRDVLDVRVTDRVGGDPQVREESRGGHTMITVWPGVAVLAADAYEMTLEYEQGRYCANFEAAGVPFCIESIRTVPDASGLIADRRAT